MAVLEPPFESRIYSSVDMKGEPGREVVIDVNETHIQWKYADEVNWNDIIALSSLIGPSGKNIELDTSATHIQWRVVGDTTWNDLIDIESLKGADAVLPANNVTGTGITHIAAVTEYPATEDPDTLYVLVSA